MQRVELDLAHILKRQQEALHQLRSEEEYYFKQVK